MTDWTLRDRRRDAGRLGALGLVAVLSLAGCGSEVASGSGSGPVGTPALHVGRFAVAGTSSIGADRYPLAGTLPQGPASETALRYDDTGAGEDRVRALALALGVDAAPSRHSHGWQVASPNGVLLVRDGADQPWSFSRTAGTCPLYSVDIDHADATSSAVGCAVSPSGSGTSVAPPTEHEALDAARPVLAHVGVDLTTASAAVQYAGLRTVTVDPVVDGAPTAGLRTVVAISRSGLAAASGHLGTASEGPAYPIVSARQALERLRAQQFALPEIACAPQPDLPADCAGPSPQIVTGATLGRLSADDGGSGVLVPAWLFSVRGSDEPVPVIAVTDEYLADVVTVSGPVATPGAGQEPGSPGSALPGAPDQPVSPAPTSDAPLQVVSVSASADGRVLTLTGWGGVCSSYHGTADETSAQVSVGIVGTSMSPGTACIAMAKQISVTVQLDAPLASRTVVDAASGTTVPVN
jgi:hypothetical protein